MMMEREREKERKIERERVRGRYERYFCTLEPQVNLS